MKPLLWIVIVALAFTGLVWVVVPPLNAQQRKCARYRVDQSPEGSGLLAQEWARAHAHPMH